MHLKYLPFLLILFQGSTTILKKKMLDIEYKLCVLYADYAFCPVLQVAMHSVNVYVKAQRI